MTEYKQLSLFDEYVEDEAEANLVEEKDGYALYQDDGAKEGDYEYRVFDVYGVAVAKWTSKVDCLSMKTNDYHKSQTRQIFFKVINQEKDKARKAEAEKAAKEKAAIAAAQKKEREKSQAIARYADDDDVSWYRGGSSTGSYKAPTYANYSYSGAYGGYKYQPKAKSTGFLNKLNKSDTLVIHCEDRSTDMLKQVYAGKGWDVLRDGDIDKGELHQLLQSHDRIVCLGHGTSGGLINVQGGGTVIGAAEAPYLKDKKLFIIWCNADGYFNAHNIGKGQFITGNMPSEVWECRAAGCGEISSQLMLENITYWSKLCADVVDRALAGDVQGAVDYVRDKYIAKYGDHPVTIYNAERTKVHGKPMEDLSDRYWGPKELLHPAKSSYTAHTASKTVPTIVASEEDDEEEEDENALSNYTEEELQDMADEVSGIYVVNDLLAEFCETVDDMLTYIEDTEALIADKHDISDVEYWTDVEDVPNIGIKVVTNDMEEYYYDIHNGRLIPW